MITCPWCGTSYIAFQPSCKKCGGPLTPPGEFDNETVLRPPPPPRQIADSYGYKLMLTDGWAIASGIFTLMGTIFTGVGFILTVCIITAFVGIPFLLIGLTELGFGIAGLTRAYKKTQQVLTVLRTGEPVDGQIVSVDVNTMVRVNNRNPWIINYQFGHNGKSYEGSVSTLNPTTLRPGQPFCVLYLPQSPEINTLYPRP
jgi:hypothetical protein